MPTKSALSVARTGNINGGSKTLDKIITQAKNQVRAETAKKVDRLFS